MIATIHFCNGELIMADRHGHPVVSDRAWISATRINGDNKGIREVTVTFVIDRRVLGEATAAPEVME